MKRFNTAMRVLGMLAVFTCLTATPSGGNSEESEFEKRIEALLKAEDYERALKLLDQFIDERPEKPIGRFLLVKTLAASGRTNKAFKEYQRLYNFSEKLSEELLFEILRGGLKDDEYQVRGQAALALGLLKDKRAVEPLISALNDDQSQVRAQAADALGLLKDKRAVEPLISALNDDQSQVRVTAALALGLLKDKRAVEPLMNALNDDQSQVRVTAASVLGLLKDKRAVEPLMNALNDDERNVVLAADLALRKMGHDPEETTGITRGQAEQQMREEKIFIRKQKFKQEFKQDKQATTLILINKLENSDSSVRGDAAWMLGYFWQQEDLKDKRVVPALINALSDDNSEVREQAAYALAGLADKPDLPALVRVLGDSKLDIHTKVYAATVLVQLSQLTPQVGD